MPLSLNEIKTYARSRGWKDLLFLAVLFSILCVLYNPPWGTDRAKWRRRTKPLALNPAVSNWKTGESGLAPCFFIVPSAATNQPAVSGTVGDCLLLVPDGRRLDLFEVPLLGGFIPVKTDIFVEDTIPLAFTRTYVPVDDWNRRFQVYVPDVYDPFLTGSRFPYTYLDWTLPDRKSIHYGRISPGTGFADAVYEAASFITVFAGSRVNWNGNGWDLSLESGTNYLSPEAYYSQRPQQGSLVGIFDGNGNEVRLSRQSNGDLTKIMSPNGRSIQLIYNEGRVSQLTDDSGDAVEYGYDVQSRLETVRFPNRQPIQYSYDASNRIVKVEDAQEGFTLQSKYDPQGYVTEIKLGDGRTYNFDYQRGNSDETFRVIIHDPEGQTTRVNVHPTKDRTSYTVDSGPSH